MSARNNFWITYCDMVFNRCYLEKMKFKIVWLDNVISIIVALATSAAVTTLAIWQKCPWLWVILTVVIQIIGLTHPLLKNQQKEYAINLMLPDVERIIIEMERDWIFIDVDTPDKIAKATLKYSTRYNDLDSKYLLGLSIKHNKWVAKRAVIERDRYLNNRMQKEETTNESAKA